MSVIAEESLPIGEIMLTRILKTENKPEIIAKKGDEHGIFLKACSKSMGRIKAESGVLV
jgi:hypothetical protein